MSLFTTLAVAAPTRVSPLEILLIAQINANLESCKSPVSPRSLHTASRVTMMAFGVLAWYATDETGRDFIASKVDPSLITKEEVVAMFRGRIAMECVIARMAKEHDGRYTKLLKIVSNGRKDIF